MLSRRFPYNYTSFNIPPSPAFPDGQIVFRPLLLATLKVPNGKTFRSLAWPDSGADHCVFPLSIADVLNLDLSRMKRQLTGGVGTLDNMTYYEKLEIDVGNGLKFSGDIGFTEGLEAQGIGLLGQRGFFESFLVTFDYASRHFWIEAREPESQSTYPVP